MSKLRSVDLEFGGGDEGEFVDVSRISCITVGGRKSVPGGGQLLFARPSVIHILYADTDFGPCIHLSDLKGLCF
jgi:hypothetical protein